MDNSKKLNNSEIKAQRVEKIFINTAKEMIIADGVDNISVRKISNEAGYTFATLYNHFKDIDELLMLTRDEIINDIASYLINNIQNQTGKELIKQTFKSYIDYCLKYPNAFKFFFLYTQKEKKSDFTYLNSMMQLGNIFNTAFATLGDDFATNPNHLKKISNTIFYSIHGILIVYLSNNYGLSEKDIYDGLNDTIEILLD